MANLSWKLMTILTRSRPIPDAAFGDPVAPETIVSPIVSKEGAGWLPEGLSFEVGTPNAWRELDWPAHSPGRKANR
jgi:hypothetical protein